MSTYSIDSLEDLSADGKDMAEPEIPCICHLSHHNSEDLHNSKRKKIPAMANCFIKGEEFNETTLIGNSDIVKFRGNSIIENAANANREFGPRLDKLPVAVGPKAHFRTGRSPEKKFNVLRRSTSSFTEFRNGCSSLTRKRSTGVSRFMKADKKTGDVQPAISSDRSKKDVSYLELYLRKFGVDGRQCIRAPVGPTVSIGDDRSDVRSAMENDNSISLIVPEEKRCEVGFERRELKLESPELQENRSSKDELDNFVKAETESSEKKDNFSSRSLSGFVGSMDRRIRVPYEPYNIEDYKSFSVPDADRSLGPDRKEIEIKGEWLMRRRTYGDSVSALNRQRILRRAEKLKHSRRNDLRKVALYPGSMDSKHPGPASKIGVDIEQSKNVIPSRSHSQPEKSVIAEHPEKGSKPRRLLPIVLQKKSTPISSKRKNKTKRSSRVVNSMWETSSDTLDDESTHLKNLLQRHFEEKKMIDRLLKRGLWA